VVHGVDAAFDCLDSGEIAIGLLRTKFGLSARSRASA
jgi:hypothetical protein